MIFGTYYDLFVDEEGNSGSYRFVGHFNSKKDLEYEKRYLRRLYPKCVMDSKFMICTDGNVQTMIPEGKPYVPKHYRSPTRMLVGWLVIVTLSAAFVYCVAMAAVTFNGF